MSRWSFLVLMLFGTSLAAQDTTVIEKPPVIITQKVFVVSPTVRHTNHGLTFAAQPLLPLLPHPTTMWKTGGMFGIKYERTVEPLRASLGISFGHQKWQPTSPKTVVWTESFRKSIVDTVGRPFQVINGDTTYYFDTINKSIYQHTEHRALLETKETHITYLIDIPFAIEWFNAYGQWELGFGAFVRSRHYFSNRLDPGNRWTLWVGLHGMIRRYIRPRWSLHIFPMLALGDIKSTNSRRSFYFYPEVGTSFWW